MTNSNDDDPIIILIRMFNVMHIEDLVEAINTFYAVAVKNNVEYDKDKALEFAKKEYAKNEPFYGKYNLDPETLAEYYLQVH